jgi:hypothetical protein
MNTDLKYKKDVFNKRVEALSYLNTLKDSIRFFVHEFNNRMVHDKDACFGSWVIADRASFVFNKTIQECDIMYVAELICELDDEIICKIEPCEGMGHYLTFAEDQVILPRLVSELITETERHFSPDSEFYEDLE